MIRKQLPQRTEWDPLAMRRELEALVAEVSDLFSGHSALVATSLPDRPPYQQHLREAYAHAGGAIAALLRAWARVEQTQVSATQAMRNLFRSLPALLTEHHSAPRSATNQDPLLDESRDLHAIPVAALGSKRVEGDGLDLAGKRRGLALEAEATLGALRDDVARYRAERAQAQPRVRDYLFQENAAAARRREELDAICGVASPSPASPAEAREPEVSPVVIDFDEGAQS